MKLLKIVITANPPKALLVDARTGEQIAELASCSIGYNPQGADALVELHGVEVESLLESSEIHLIVDNPEDAVNT